MFPRNGALRNPSSVHHPPPASDPRRGMQMDSYFAFQDEQAASFFAVCPTSPELLLQFGYGGGGGGSLVASPPAVVAAAARESAFQEYYGVRHEVSGSATRGAAGSNIHRRLMGVLSRMGSAGVEEEQEERRPRQRQQQGGAVESSRGFRHMMRERQRREKLSQSYADLYDMVSARSKGDKNSIVQSAAIYIRELKRAKEQLQRTSEELKAKILGHDTQQQCVKVQFEVDEPSSSVDSMIGALRRLKSMNVKTRGIRSDLSTGHTLTTEINVETTIAACEVEQAVEEALREVERKQQQHHKPDDNVSFRGSSRCAWSQAHAQNVF